MTNSTPPVPPQIPTIILAEQDLVEAYQEEVDEILLVILGHTQALVTDWSQVSDFNVELSPPKSAQLEDLLGRPVAAKEHLGCLAKELRAARDIEAQRASLEKAVQPDHLPIRPDHKM